MALAKQNSGSRNRKSGGGNYIKIEEGYGRTSTLENEQNDPNVMSTQKGVQDTLNDIKDSALQKENTGTLLVNRTSESKKKKTSRFMEGFFKTHIQNVQHKFLNLLY